MKHKQINNRKELEPFRKKLRNNSTSAEITLWILLKGKQLDGRKFRRQHSVGSYIIDFYCPAERLAVELDGAYHFTQEQQRCDEVRTEYLNSVDIRVIRFENREVFENAEKVLEKIRACFKANN